MYFIQCVKKSSFWTINGALNFDVIENRSLLFLADGRVTGFGSGRLAANISHYISPPELLNQKWRDS